MSMLVLGRGIMDCAEALLAALGAFLGLRELQTITDRRRRRYTQQQKAMIRLRAKERL